MEIDLDLKTNRMIIDFKDDEEFDDFIKFMEDAGYKVKKSQAYN
jgi:hypothetical protein